MVNDRNWRRAAPVLVVGFALFYLATLGVRPMARPDEFRYGEIAREMLASGDWVTPRLNGLRYFEKPILGYWVDAAALGAVGESAFALRLPSALATGLTAWFLWAFLRRATGRVRAGALAAFAYLTCLGVWGIGGIGILDPLLNLTLTMAIGLYYLAWTAPDAWRRTGLLLAVGAGCGLAFLTKGFLALAIPVLVIAPFLIWQRDWARLLRDPWPALLAAAAVVLPWALLIHAREPDFWPYFFWEEHVRRFFADDAQHARAWWLFVPVLPAFAMPWTAAVPAAAAGLRAAGVDRRLAGYGLLWLVMPFLFFSASEGKLLTYILPCLPPFALLVGLGLDAALGQGRTATLRGAARALLVAFVLGLAYLLVNGLGGAGRPLYGAGEAPRWAGALAAFAWGTVLAALAARPGPPARRAGLIGASVLGIFLALPFVLPQATRDSKMPGELLEQARAATRPDTVLVAEGTMFHAVCWVFRRDDVFVLEANELDYGLKYPDGAGRLLSPAELGALIAANAGRRDVAVITQPSREVRLLPYLPAGAHRAASGRFVVWRVPAAAGGKP